MLIVLVVDLVWVEGLMLVVEIGNGIMVNFNYIGCKLIDDLDVRDVFKVFWDLVNNCWCYELVYLDGYEELCGGYFGYVYIKDVKVDILWVILEVCWMGEG